MILDKGFCTIYQTGNTAEANESENNVLKSIRHQSWYGELNFETAMTNPTVFRQDSEISQRVRVIQNRSIENGDIVLLSNVLPPLPDTAQYEIVRSYHGIDKDNGQPISDLSLRRVHDCYENG